MGLKFFCIKTAICVNIILILLPLFVLRAQTVLLITGLSGSGKTTVCTRLKSLLNVPKSDGLPAFPWTYVSLDNSSIETKDKDDSCWQEDNERIHSACLEKIYQGLETGNNVLCDTIIENDCAYELYAKKMRTLQMKYGVTILTVYMHCSLSVLVERLHARNKKAQSGSRSLSDLLQCFDKMFFSVKNDCGFGCIAQGAVSTIINTEKYMKKFDKNILKQYLAKGLFFNVEKNHNENVVLPTEKTFIYPRFSYNIFLDANKLPENIAYALYQLVIACEKNGTCDSKALKKMNGFSWLKVPDYVKS